MFRDFQNEKKWKIALAYKLANEAVAKKIRFLENNINKNKRQKEWLEPFHI